ncbi:hypothetical protein Tco_1375975 [Tanacetum coccineum]
MGVLSIKKMMCQRYLLRFCYKISRLLHSKEIYATHVSNMGQWSIPLFQLRGQKIGWTLEFSEEEEEDELSVEDNNDGRINDLEANNGIDESDLEEVLETLFDQPDDQKTTEKIEREDNSFLVNLNRWYGDNSENGKQNSEIQKRYGVTLKLPLVNSEGSCHLDPTSFRGEKLYEIGLFCHDPSDVVEIRDLSYEILLFMCLKKLNKSVGGNSKEQAWKEIGGQGLSRLSNGRWKLPFNRRHLTISLIRVTNSKEKGGLGFQAVLPLIEFYSFKWVLRFYSQNFLYGTKVIKTIYCEETEVEQNVLITSLEAGNGENTRFWLRQLYEGGGVIKERSHLCSLLRFSDNYSLPCEIVLWTLEIDWVFSVLHSDKDIDESFIQDFSLPTSG